jgi:hypothetical protein
LLPIVGLQLGGAVIQRFLEAAARRLKLAPEKLLSTTEILVLEGKVSPDELTA